MVKKAADSAPNAPSTYLEMRNLSRRSGDEKKEKGTSSFQVLPESAEWILDPIVDKAPKLQLSPRKGKLGGEGRIGANFQISIPGVQTEIKGTYTLLGHLPNLRSHARFFSRAKVLDIESR